MEESLKVFPLLLQPRTAKVLGEEGHTGEKQVRLGNTQGPVTVRVRVHTTINLASQPGSLLPRKKVEQFLVFFFLHFIISNQVNSSIKREKSKEVFNAEGPDLGGGHEGHDPSAGSSGS